MTLKTQDLCLNVYIQPNASKSEIVGQHDGKLKIRIKAPALENKANQELIRFLAKEFKIPKSQIEIIKGQNSRNKTLCIRNSSFKLDHKYLENSAAEDL